MAATVLRSAAHVFVTRTVARSARLSSTTAVSPPSNRAAKRELPELLQRLWRLAPWQVAFLGVGTFFTGVTALSTFNDRVPGYVVYVRSTVVGEGEKTPPADPKAEVKLLNNGEGPTHITGIEIRANGQLVKSLRDAIGTSPKFVMSTESEPFLQGGFKGRDMKKQSSMVVAVLRPLGDEKSMEWEHALREALSKRNVEVTIKYQYFYVPFFGLLLSSKKTSKL
jgi:hypothetical protein